MKLQEEILNQFNRQFPNATLKEVSKKTGIQITRVFRIINGYEMKISEYEKFHQLLLNDQNKNLCEHLKVYTTYIESIETENRERLEKKYLDYIYFSNLKTPHFVLNSSQPIFIGGLQNA